jgi:hypothetical protein
MVGLVAEVATMATRTVLKVGCMLLGLCDALMLHRCWALSHACCDTGLTLPGCTQAVLPLSLRQVVALPVVVVVTMMMMTICQACQG